MYRPNHDIRGELELTPLGPGGQPFARWRPLAALLALAALVAIVMVLLSERAPSVIDTVSDRAASRITDASPEARQAADRAVARSGVSEKDTLAHIGLWSAAALLLGLATWSWRSLMAVVVVMLAGSTALELGQERLAPSRITEWSDVAANVVGIGVGLAAVIALTSVSGLPARLRRWRRPDRGILRSNAG